MIEHHTEPSSVNRVAFASFLGTAIEWYDFFLFGTAAALVFPRIFFPNDSALVGTINSYLTFSIGFLARPVGGIFFGHFGDRLGRRGVFSVTLIAMGLATTAIGILPTYNMIGAAAPMLLILLRVAQGFGVGGEWGGAVLMTVEHAPRNRKGFYGSLPQTGVIAGLALGTLAFRAISKLPEDKLFSWGWRIPFLLSVVLVIVGAFIRSRISESPAFGSEHGAASDETPIIAVLRYHWRQVVIATGARFAENGLFYIYATFVLTYATKQVHLERDVVLDGVLIAACCSLFTLPAFGLLSDYVGRRRVYLAGAVFSLLYAFPFFWILDTGSSHLLWLALVLGMALGHAAMYGPQASFFAELFGVNIRYSGASLGYQLASALAGGFSPVIATALLARAGGKPWPIATYMCALSFITVASLLFARVTLGREGSTEDQVTTSRVRG